MAAFGRELALDCGSGGTRAWRPRRGGGVERVLWPGGGPAPVLTQALSSAAGREAFATGVRLLPAPPFIGATAGLRHALERGTLTEAHVEALRALLPAGAVVAVLSPLKEAQFELRALRRSYPDPTAAMLSLGGKSMQLGREGCLSSLPFAMHLGFDLLQAAGPSWPADVATVQLAYASAAAAAVALQGLQPLDGLVVGVTDAVDVGEALGLLDAPPLSRDALLQALTGCVGTFRDMPRDRLSRADFQLLARAMAVHAAAAALLAPTARFAFPSAGRVSWTEGFFLATGARAD
jgi:hypothetical protein